jgi:chromosome segregation ATPase
MICPKCGFEQEERLDCKECGIVFSKYQTLFPSGEAAQSTDEDPQMKSEFRTLQIQVRELSSRMLEAEFEKAERKKLRADLKELEERIQKNQEQVETGMQQIGQALEKILKESDNKIPQESLHKLPVPEKFAEETNRLAEKLGATVDQLTTLWEKTGQNSFQLTELRNQMSALRDEVVEVKKQLANLEKIRKVEPEPQTILEDDLKAIRKNLDELGQFISGLGKKGTNGGNGNTHEYD